MITEKEQIRGNILIGKYMHYERVAGVFDVIVDISDPELTMDFYADELRFHESFDWIFPAVRKLKRDLPKDDQTREGIDHAWLSMNIELLWKSVVGAIHYLIKMKQ